MVAVLMIRVLPPWQLVPKSGNRVVRRDSAVALPCLTLSLGGRRGKKEREKNKASQWTKLDAIVPDDMSFCRACSVEAIRANVSEGPG